MKPSDPPVNSVGKIGRRLILMRHAKSDWSKGGTSDHDRPLNDRGRRDAPEMAKWLVDEGYCPDLILCSSATRTQETANLMLEHWSSKPTLSISRSLYLAPQEAIFELLRTETIVADDDTEQSPETILVLAHNPGISEAVGWLSGQMAALPTAALAVFRCSGGGWHERVNNERASMIASMKPKALDRREA